MNTPLLSGEAALTRFHREGIATIDHAAFFAAAHEPDVLVHASLVQNLILTLQGATEGSS